MYLRIAAASYSFEGDKFTKTFDRDIKTLLRQSMRAFIRAAYPRIPVLTGMARGAYLAAARQLNVAVFIRPTLVRRDRGPEIGESQSLYEFTAANWRYTVAFETSVIQILINDFNAMNYPHGQVPTPWGAWAAGTEAFWNYFYKNLPKYKLKNWVRVTGVKNV